MKIAFIGTHGVGKTTLCFAIAAKLKRLGINVELVKETARECPLPINRDTGFASQCWMIHTQIAKELVSSQHYSCVVCDRAIFDNYAYLVNKMGRQIFLEPMIKNWLGTYDYLFRIPLWRQPDDDGIRDTDAKFQGDIDDCISALSVDLGVEMFQLDPTRHDYWVDDVINEIGIKNGVPSDPS